MFVIDFIAASILTVVLTIGFTEAVRRSGYPRVHKMSAPVWLMSIGSWLGGIALLAFGPPLTGTHWLPFAVAGLLAGLLLLILPGLPKFGPAEATAERKHDARSAIAVYFIVTLLLFSCAISVRFYIVHLA